LAPPSRVIAHSSVVSVTLSEVWRVGDYSGGEYLFRDEGTRYALVMIDLKNASRAELIALIVSQHETIARQERVIAA